MASGGEDSRNRAWADDQKGFGYKMLTKMGWKGQGSGLGKNEDGMSSHVRVKRRVADSGIGSEMWSSTKGGGPSGTANRIDAAAGLKTWEQTNANFADVLASLNATHKEEVKKMKKKRKKTIEKKMKKSKKRKTENQGGSAEDSSLSIYVCRKHTYVVVNEITTK